MKIDTVQLINRETKPFWIAGLARELWPLLINRLDELNNDAKIAVKHYSKQAREIK